MNVMDQYVSDRVFAYNADTIEVARSLEAESVDLQIYSPPFGDMFAYSAHVRDFSNCRSYAEFWEQYDILIKETRRVMAPGRLVVAHCMDLPLSKVRDGRAGLRDFPGDILRAHEKVGFVYHSRVTIWKCPVVAVTRTKARGLLHCQLRKDAAVSRQGIADTLIVMRTPGENSEPITHEDPSDPLRHVPLWQRVASPVWATYEGTDPEGFAICTAKEVFGDDTSGIDQGNVLSAREARDEDDSKHLCALQLGVIRRCIRLWSNPGDLVWSPFAGIGSELVVAIEEGRRGLGAELKSAYFKQLVRNVRNAESGDQQSLFGRA